MKLNLFILILITLISQKTYAAGAANPGSMPMEGEEIKKTAPVTPNSCYRLDWFGNPTSETEEMTEARVQELIAIYAQRAQARLDAGHPNEICIKSLSSEIKKFPVGSRINAHIHFLMELIKSNRL